MAMPAVLMRLSLKVVPLVTSAMVAPVGTPLPLSAWPTLSAAVLAAVWCYFYPAAGACMVVVALLICALRVLAGAHYVRDVAAGALLGFALGAAGMWLL